MPNPAKNLLSNVRIQHHFSIAMASLFVIVFCFFFIEKKSFLFKLSMGTAYASLILLSLSLLIGPWNLYRNKKNPVSSYLRRDIGIWTGIIGIIHVIIGLQVHFSGRFWLYFIFPENKPHLIPIRYDPFGLTNYAGLIAGLILITLLIISNNISINKLGAIRWKKIQRFNYFCAGLVLLHGIVYQFLEKRTLFFVLCFILISLMTCIGQFWGYRIKRKKLAS